MSVSLWVQITGVDREPKLRSGDLSLGGLFMEVPHEVGDVGSVQRLTIASGDAVHAVTVLSRIVRTSTVDDLWRGRQILGVAFQFVSEERDGRVVPAHESPSIRALLQHAVEDGAERGMLELDHTFEGALAGAVSASISGVNLLGMWLETDRALPLGERVRVEVPTHGEEAPVTFEGEVVESQEAAPGQPPDHFRTRVRFQAESAASEPVTESWRLGL